jgi:hypothetical protein
MHGVDFLFPGEVFRAIRAKESLSNSLKMTFMLRVQTRVVSIQNFAYEMLYAIGRNPISFLIYKATLFFAMT